MTATMTVTEHSDLETSLGLHELCELVYEIGSYVPETPEDLGRARADVWMRAGEVEIAVPYMVRNVITYLLSFFFNLAVGSSPEEDKEVSRSYSSEELYRALSRVAIYREEAHCLCLLLVANRAEEDGLYPNLGGRGLSHELLAVQVAAGEILGELEEHDPHLQVAGPGIRSYVERVHWGLGKRGRGSMVNCSTLVGTLLATLARIRA